MNMDITQNLDSFESSNEAQVFIRSMYSSSSDSGKMSSLNMPHDEEMYHVDQIEKKLMNQMVEQTSDNQMTDEIKPSTFTFDNNTEKEDLIMERESFSGSQVAVQKPPSKVKYFCGDVDYISSTDCAERGDLQDGVVNSNGIADITTGRFNGDAGERNNWCSDKEEICIAINPNPSQKDEVALPDGLVDVPTERHDEVARETNNLSSNEEEAVFTIMLYLLVMRYITKLRRKFVHKTYGCYLDAEYNCLKIDGKPWIEYGGIRDLKEKILSKMNICKKKCILVLPQWISRLLGENIICQDIEEIGRGTTSVVYKTVITNTVFSLVLARKVVHRNLWRNQEVEALLQLQDYSFVPKVYGVDVQAQSISLIMELMNGDMLSAYINGNIETIVRLFKLLLQNVIVLHTKDIYHHDLNVNNVMVVKEKGELSVAFVGFGSVILPTTRMKFKKKITTFFCPPEEYMLTKALSRPFDERIRRLLMAWDSWYAGMILIELLCGKYFIFRHQVTQQNMNSTRCGIKYLINKYLREVKEQTSYDIFTVVVGLLEPDYRKRLTPEEALQILDDTGPAS